MKIALIHDYLYTYGGGERVLELFHELYPDADIYTLLYNPSKMPAQYRTWHIKTSFLQKVPFAAKLQKLLVPFMPPAIESFDLTDYDLVISITSGFAKGVLTSVHTCHISYTLTVPRYLWGYDTSTQVKQKNNLFSLVLPMINNYLRIWDKVAADRVDYFIANSQTVKNRIAKSYQKAASVIYSPVDESVYNLSTIKREDFYLIVSRLERYKRIDLAIETCKKYNKKLTIIGTGPDMKYLESLANENISLLGYQDDATVLRYFKSAHAVLFPGADDMGLVPIEAQMVGTPVIAYKRDGAIETITDQVSGVFFAEQTEESLYQAMHTLEKLNLQPEHIRNAVQQFAKSRVKEQLTQYIDHCLTTYKRVFD